MNMLNEHTAAPTQMLCACVSTPVCLRHVCLTATGSAPPGSCALGVRLGASPFPQGGLWGSPLPGTNQGASCLWVHDP